MNVRVAFHHKVHKDHKENSHCHIKFFVPFVFFAASPGRLLDRMRLVLSNKALLRPTYGVQYLSNCREKILKLHFILRDHLDNHLAP